MKNHELTEVYTRLPLTRILSINTIQNQSDWMRFVVDFTALGPQDWDYVEVRNSKTGTLVWTAAFASVEYARENPGAYERH